MAFIPAELIAKKKSGAAHSAEEIQWIVNAFTSGELPDYQMSAWAMAVCFQGMNGDEVAVFTAAMRDSGKKFSFSHLNAPRIDKHSTGGVGDKTSLIIGPLMAAAEVYTPMIAGRGLGHTGGTLDKLESIPGFRVHLSRDEFSRLVQEKHFALMGQTADICPADRKLYSLRDVTATIDSIPLICGSIMSKKLSEDLTGLVLDVKFGNGAFMRTLEDAENLATWLKKTGDNNGVKTHALLTNMNSPLGRFSGNACEIEECLAIMRNEKFIDGDTDYFADTRELSLQLTAHGLYLGKKAASVEDGYKLAEQLLESGAAYKKFIELCKYQGPSDIDHLPKAKHSKTITSPASGTLHEIDTKQLGLSLVELGAGRKVSADPVDYSAGLEMQVKLGQSIERGQPFMRIFGENESRVKEAARMASSAFILSMSSPTKVLPLVAKVIT
jgi:pyrimidine-nucleoside phosphorylase